MRLTFVATATLLLLIGCGAPTAVEPVHVRTIDTTSIPTTTSTSSTSTSTTAVPRGTTPPRPVVHAATVARPTLVPAGTLSPLLRRIGGCESSGSSSGPLLWTRTNQHSTASGAFQDLDSTWRSWARVYGGDVGASSYTRAMDAPPDVQITVNERALEAQGTGPWVSSRPCWG